MADYIHMDNIIQGAVLQIRERRPLEEQAGMLEVLVQFLGDQRQKVLMEKLRVEQALSELHNPPADEQDAAPSADVIPDDAPAVRPPARAPAGRSEGESGNEGEGDSRRPDDHEQDRD